MAGRGVIMAQMETKGSGGKNGNLGSISSGVANDSTIISVGTTK